MLLSIEKKIKIYIVLYLVLLTGCTSTSIIENGIVKNEISDLVTIEQVNSLLEMKKLYKALLMVNKYLSTNPRNPEALFIKGLILFERRSINECITIFTNLKNEYPSKKELYNNLATALIVKGDFNKALNNLYKAIEIDPDYTLAYINIGKIYINIAQEKYKKGLKIEGDNNIIQAEKFFRNSIKQAPNKDINLWLYKIEKINNFDNLNARISVLKATSKQEIQFIINNMQTPPNLVVNKKALIQIHLK